MGGRQSREVELGGCWGRVGLRVVGGTEAVLLRGMVWRASVAQECLKAGGTEAVVLWMVWRACVAGGGLVEVHAELDEVDEAEARLTRLLVQAQHHRGLEVGGNQYLPPLPPHTHTPLSSSSLPPPPQSHAKYNREQ